jgi:hypothetical protein
VKHNEEQNSAGAGHASDKVEKHGAVRQQTRILGDKGLQQHNEDNREDTKEDQ